MIFSTILSETLLIVRRIKRDIVINLHRSSCKIPVIIACFNETWILLPGVELFHADGRTDRRGEANGRFWQFCQPTQKLNNE
jgi:hypothetical protein